MSVTQLRPPKERLPGPYPKGRRCSACKSFLRTCNPGPLCDPCSGHTSEPTEAEVFERIGSMPDVRQRRKAFEAYAEIQERKAA